MEPLNGDPSSTFIRATGLAVDTPAGDARLLRAKGLRRIDTIWSLMSRLTSLGV
jgi:hypothetical protein